MSVLNAQVFVFGRTVICIKILILTEKELKDVGQFIEIFKKKKLMYYLAFIIWKKQNKIV